MPDGCSELLVESSLKLLLSKTATCPLIPKKGLSSAGSTKGKHDCKHTRGLSTLALVGGKPEEVRFEIKTKDGQIA